MKYRANPLLYVDWDIWERLPNLTKAAKEIGCDRSSLSKLRSGDDVASWEFYQKIKAVAYPELGRE